MPRFDLILLHAPHIYDFRKINHIFFPYLIRNYDVPVTSMQELYPSGLRAAQQYLIECGLKVKIVNIAFVMLQNPNLDIRLFLRALNTDLFGIDLQWIVHAQGALALAKDIKTVHPRTPIVLGGLTATYYHKELINYPQVDFVLRGYDTLRLLYRLILAVKRKKGFGSIPNLAYKVNQDSIGINSLSYAPDETSYWINWANDKTILKVRRPAINLILGAGCGYNCAWCGGSSYFYRRVMKRKSKSTKINRSIKGIIKELESLKNLNNPAIYIHGYRYGNKVFLSRILSSIKSNIRVHFEVFYLLEKETIELIKKYIHRPVFILNLGSHDSRIRRICGRPVFTNARLENWITNVVGAGGEIQIWFYVGLPHQPPESVNDTVEYSIRLMEKFGNYKVSPLIQPLVRLEPGSRFYEKPDKFGYRLFYRSLKEYCAAAVSFPWGSCLNYETEWMSREKIIEVFYAALKKLARARCRYGFLPESLSERIEKNIDDSVKIVSEINIALKKGDGKDIKKIKNKIKRYNRRHIYDNESPLFPLVTNLHEKLYYS